MRRIVASLAAALAVAAGAAWATAPEGFTHRLPARPTGGVAATQLPNGEPVFVVRHAPDDVSVFSAVSTHREHVVAWCPDSEVFVEPVGATRFDTRGRWLPGPAPTGLAPYESELSADGRHVLVGRLREPIPRWQEGQAPQGGWGQCAESEGSGGGVFPAGAHPDEAGDVGELAATALGRFVPVSATIDFSLDPARLCPPAPDGRCPEDAVRVRSFFWDELWDVSPREWATSVTGEFLVRKVGSGVVDRVAVLVGLEGLPPPYTYSVTWVLRDDAPAREQSAEYVGMLDRVTIAADEVRLHAADGFRAVDGFDGPPPALPARVDGVGLRRPLGMVSDRGLEDAFNQFAAPDDLARRLDGGSIPVRFRYSPGQRLWSVTVYDSLDDAVADR